MFVSAKAFFKDGTKANNRLLFRAKTELPREWIKRYRKNVVAMTPKKSSRLRRSIITQSMNGKAEISWRAPYARAQEYGGHDKPGQYKKYTTAGTGRYFGRKAFQMTNKEMPQVVRGLGLTK